MKINIIIITNKGFDRETYLKMNKIEKVISDIAAKNSVPPKIYYDLEELKEDQYYLVFNASSKTAFEKYGPDCDKIILINTDRGISNESGVEANFLGVVDFLTFILDNHLMYGHPKIVNQLEVREVQRFNFKNGKELVLFNAGPGKTWGELIVDYLNAFEK
jgi:hypothetical protein